MEISLGPPFHLQVLGRTFQNLPCRYASLQDAPGASRENNRGASEFGLEIVEFCPKCADFVLNQGINSEFCGFLPTPLSTKRLALFSPGLKKITRNDQGSSVFTKAFSAVLFRPTQKQIVVSFSLL